MYQYIPISLISYIAVVLANQGQIYRLHFCGES